MTLSESQNPAQSSEKKAADEITSPVDARARDFIGARFEGLDGAVAAHSRAISIAGIVADLGAGPDIVAASLLYPFLEDKLCSNEQLVSSFGDELAALTRSLAEHSKFGFPQDWKPEKRLRPEACCKLPGTQ